MTAFVIAVYVGLVSVLGGLLSTRASLGLSLVATVVVAVLFEPARRRIQLGVDRLLFGERRNPSAVLARLGRLESTLAPDLVLAGVAQTVASALRLPYAAVELSLPDQMVQAVHGDAVAEPVVVPLVYQQEPVGRLLVSPRAPGERFTGVERRLLDDLAGQVALIASAVRLTVDLQHARERLVLGREEERRRLHRDLHDGLGPTLAGVVLGLDAVRRALGWRPGGRPAAGGPAQGRCPGGGGRHPAAGVRAAPTSLGRTRPGRRPAQAGSQPGVGRPGHPGAGPGARPAGRAARRGGGGRLPDRA